MVERILSMLTQFLISNQSLQINKSFKVYIKILSINHMASRETRQHVKRNKLFYKNLPKKSTMEVKKKRKKLLIIIGLSMFQIHFMVNLLKIILKINVF